MSLNLVFNNLFGSKLFFIYTAFKIGFILMILDHLRWVLRTYDEF